MARSDDPSWELTERHNIRVPAEVWDPADEKAKRLKAAGYSMPGAPGNSGGVDMSKLARQAYAQFTTEDDEQTIARLGLTKTATEVP